MKTLSSEFFARPTLEVARDLIGKLLVHDHPEAGRLVGRIVEAEAYTQDDPSYRGWGVFDAATGLVRPEGRARDLFEPPGLAYLYRAYQRYWMLNVVTEAPGIAGAVLIRALEPLHGRPAMFERRPAARREVDLTNGPGKLTQAFDIDGRFHGRPLTQPPLFFAEPDVSSAVTVATSSRIGLNFGVELPYRFYAAGHPCVSPGIPSEEAARRRRLRRTRRLGRRKGQ